MIEPTVGRVVLYTPRTSESGGSFPSGEQRAAIIARVFHDRMVNLTVFDANGVPCSFTSVQLLQDDDPKPISGGFCEWMDYQKGQAAKTEALEASLAASALSAAVVAKESDLLTDTKLDAALAKRPAPRVTEDEIMQHIKDVRYWILEGTTTTLCQITVDNGYSVRGESACVSPANFDPAIGRTYAYKDAFRKLWPLFGFLLAEKLFRALAPSADT